MKKYFESLLPKTLAFFVLVVVVIPTYAYTISGKLVSVKETGTVDTANEQSESIDETQLGEEQELATNTIAVSISYELANDDGTTQQVDIERHFIDGLVEFEGTLDEPTPVNISVTVGAEEPVGLFAVIEPEDDFLFEFVDNPAPKRDKITAIGTLRLYEDPGKKFTISGDLSSMNLDLSSAIVEVLGWESDPATGDTQDVFFGKAKFNDGRFVIEGQVHEPIVAVVVIVVGSAYTQFQAIVEADADITVSPRGTLYTLGASAKSGRHARLVDSWRATSEFERLMDEYDAAHQEFYRKPQKPSETVKSVEVETSSDSMPPESTSQMDAELSASSNSEELDSQETDSQTKSDSNGSRALRDEGCEHVEIEEVASPQMSESTEEILPLHRQLSLQMEQTRAEALENIATNAEDPIDALLTLEMGAHSFAEEALPIFDRLAVTLDDDLVGRRVTHFRNDLASYLANRGISKSLSPGGKAPDFTLSNLEGQNISLQDLLSENELVLIEFWATWCGPCIESFPALAQIYDEFRDDGFEIASISVDATREAWEQGSMEHELAWVNLGQEQGFEGDVAKSYGVTFLPQTYLVDSKGCIIQKRLSSDHLEELLEESLGR